MQLSVGLKKKWWLGMRQASFRGEKSAAFAAPTRATLCYSWLSQRLQLVKFNRHYTTTELQKFSLHLLTIWKLLFKNEHWWSLPCSSLIFVPNTIVNKQAMRKCLEWLLVNLLHVIMTSHIGLPKQPKGSFRRGGGIDLITLSEMMTPGPGNIKWADA
jgi:hypothetical protein